MSLIDGIDPHQESEYGLGLPIDFLGLSARRKRMFLNVFNFDCRFKQIGDLNKIAYTRIIDSSRRSESELIIQLIK